MTPTYNNLKEAIRMLANEIDQYEQEKQRLKEMEGKITDILHILELNKDLSGPKILETTKELRAALRTRREIKNKVLLIGIAKNTADAQIKGLKKYAENNDNRIYTPRTNYGKVHFTKTAA